MGRHAAQDQTRADLNPRSGLLGNHVGVRERKSCRRSPAQSRANKAAETPQKDSNAPLGPTCSKLTILVPWCFRITLPIAGVPHLGCASSNARTPRRFKPRRFILFTTCPKKNHSGRTRASDLLVSADLGVESRCPAMDSSRKCPVESCSGSDFPVKGSLLIRGVDRSGWVLLAWLLFLVRCILFSFVTHLLTRSVIWVPPGEGPCCHTKMHPENRYTL